MSDHIIAVLAPVPTLVLAVLGLTVLGVDTHPLIPVAAYLVMAVVTASALRRFRVRSARGV